MGDYLEKTTNRIVDLAQSASEIAQVSDMNAHDIDRIRIKCAEIILQCELIERMGRFIDAVHE